MSSFFDETMALEENDVNLRWAENGNPAEVLARPSGLGAGEPTPLSWSWWWSGPPQAAPVKKTPVDLGPKPGERDTGFVGKQPGLFTSTEPSAEARSEWGSPFQSNVLQALDKWYVLRPMGGESLISLQRRIAGVYWDHTFDTWRTTPLPDQIKSDPRFQKILRVISPTARRRSPGEGAQMEPKDISKPKPGSVPVKFNTMDEIMKVVNAGFKQLAEFQKQRLANEIARRQQRNQPIYIEKTVLEKAKDENGKKPRPWPWEKWDKNTKIAVGVGVGAFALLLLAAATGTRR